MSSLSRWLVRYSPATHKRRRIWRRLNQMLQLRCNRWSGGGGNRTRVRGRTGMSVYKHRSPLNFARRPVGDRPTDELALLKCRASDEWLFFGAEPAS